MIRKTRLADGMEIGLPVCGPPAVSRAIERHLEAHGEWLVDLNSRTWRGSQLALSGLLRDLCNLPFAQIAHMCRTSVWNATKRAERHNISIAESGNYAATVSAIAHAALEATIPD